MRAATLFSLLVLLPACGSKEDTGELCTWYADSDGDGYGIEGDTTSASCLDALEGYAAGPGDCDDMNADINPGAPDTCDGVDNDCDGAADDNSSIWYPDTDGDGWGDDAGAVSDCENPGGLVARGGDCDDSSVLVYPGAPETCDEQDNDCDGTTDEDDAQGAPTWYRDEDMDGHGLATETTTACDPPEGWSAADDDCDDQDPSSFPGAEETCDDADNDCDGETDEAGTLGAVTWYLDRDSDGYGLSGSTVTSCDAPDGYAPAGGDCDDRDPAFNPGAPETDCTDPNDYNCDGSTGFADEDRDGAAACVDCLDTDPTIFPGATETCDGMDNDCDALVDEDGATGSRLWYVDADGDSYGSNTDIVSACAEPDGYVAEGGDCDDTSASVRPGATETANGMDDDCDGEVDEGTGTTAWSHEVHIQPIWDESCTGCHGGASPSGSLDLSGDAWDDIVGVASTQVATLSRVEPADSASSYLYLKLTGTHTTVGGRGVTMPKGSDPLPDETLAMIAAWIDEGALE